MKIKGNYTSEQLNRIQVILDLVGEDAKSIKTLEIYNTDSVKDMHEAEGGQSNEPKVFGYSTFGRIVIAANLPLLELGYVVIHELGHLLYGNSEQAADDYFKQKSAEIIIKFVSVFA